MVIFVLWQSSPETPPPATVAERLRSLFEPVLTAVPEAGVLEGGGTCLVWLELPVRGWKPPSFEADERTSALAPDYPVVGERELGALGVSAGTAGALPALARALQREPAALLSELAPPFSLIWHDRASGDTHVQNDGLGQAQLFEYHDGRRWALTNRILALRALEIPLAVAPEEWATRMTLGWFPMQTTGYRDVRFLEPGTQLRLERGVARRSRVDVLSGWLHPGSLAREECLELARESLVRQVCAALPLWEEPSVGLSGGWDTRAVVAVMRSLGATFRPRVRDKPGRRDAQVATELARLAGLELRVNSSTSRPTGDAAAYRRSVALALRWQAGYMETSKHRTFLQGNERLGRGVVNVMGQHGEIGRAYYARRVRASGLDEARAEERLLAWLTNGATPFLRPELREHARAAARKAYRQADEYGLTGPRRLDFFYLYERTRRWASGSLSAQKGVAFAPFLNPGFIRAVFAYEASDRQDNPFHRHIISTHAPEWTAVPFAHDVRPADRHELKRQADEAWIAVAEPTVREALAQAGTWTEIYSPDLVAEQWRAAPDHVAIAHLLDEALAPTPADGP